MEGFERMIGKVPGTGENQEMVASTFKNKEINNKRKS